jgi:hypothetical protein
MQQQKLFWTHLVVLCSLEQKGGAAVHLLGTSCHQTLASKSGILWIYGELWCFQDNWEHKKKQLVES